VWLAAGGAVAVAAVAWLFLHGSGVVRREAGLDVLLVTIDTLRADALGSYGNTRASTPWMDRLAAGGVRFEQAHAHNVVTLPSHANILSGRYPLDHGIRDNAGFRFPRDAATLATLLRERGYRTGAFISAFPLSSRFGLERGFDLYDDRFLTGAGSPLAEQERPGAETVAAARRWLEGQAGAPRFAWVHLYEPHFPYAPPAEVAARFPGDSYAGEVATADAALAPLLAPLLEAGRRGRTLVVLTADHGESLGEHGEKTHGLFAYEGPLRVPLVLYCPRLFGPRVAPGPARHVDLLPTVLDALAAPIPDGLPGRSLLPMAAGGAGASVPSYFEALSGLVNRRWAPLYGVVQDRTKYIDLPLPELYDLERDPREERNLAASEPQRLERLRAVLAGLRASERGIRRERESAETRDRLRALGYLSGADAAPPRERYSPDDDPKRLVALDAELQGVNERLHAGDVPGALALCRDIVARRARMPQPLVQLASLQRITGDLDGAIRSARAALALNPDDPDTAALLGGYLNDAGRGREAADLLQPYAERTDPLPEVLLVRGAALAGTGRRREAMAAFEKVRELAPAHAMALVNIGTLRLTEGDLAGAQGAFDQALALNPGLTEAHNALGVIASRSGRPEDSIRHWRRAIELDPDAFDTLYNLGLELRRQGRAAEARPYLERFARDAPSALYARDLARVRSWLTP
jgi:tetratricopeptide (TPR) repeat protein